MTIKKQFEKAQVEKLTKGKAIPDFAAGDTLKVRVKIVEGERTRVQAFEGVCIGRKNAGLNSAFTMRKVSYGEGLERVFPLYSPNIESIEVMRRGEVRRSKLYFLRDRRGKSARITEKLGALIDMSQADAGQGETSSAAEGKEPKAKAAPKKAAGAKG